MTTRFFARAVLIAAVVAGLAGDIFAADRTRTRRATMLAQAKSRSPEALPTPEEHPHPVPDPTMSPDSTMSLDGEPMLDDGDFGPGCCDDGGCNDCFSHGRACGAGYFFVGGEYILFRPRMSQGVAEVRRTIVNDESTTGETSTTLDESIEYHYDYESSFRVFAGYRLSDCDADVQLTYWRLQADSNPVFDGPANLEEGPVIFGQLVDPNDGEFYSARSSVEADIFDLDFSKGAVLGGGGDCCDPCGCPRWDVRWSAGLRIADIERHDRNLVSNSGGAGITAGDFQADFEGAGPRVGLAGRRYFGPCGRLSLFAKGNQGLLLGDYTVRRTAVTPGSVNETTIITEQRDDLTRLVPVSEVEVGATWQVGCRTFVSAGWFFQAWWDLGSSQDIACCDTSFGSLDDSNILAFDGLFLRGEIQF